MDLNLYYIRLYIYTRLIYLISEVMILPLVLVKDEHFLFAQESMEKPQS